MSMRLPQSPRRATLHALTALAVVAVVVASPHIALAGLAPLGAAWEGPGVESTHVASGPMVLGAKGDVESRQDPSEPAIEVPEPGVPILLIGLGILGVALAASHRLRAEAASQNLFEDWQTNCDPHDGRR